jgi:hypothetical protein
MKYIKAEETWQEISTEGIEFEPGSLFEQIMIIHFRFGHFLTRF